MPFSKIIIVRRILTELVYGDTSTLNKVIRIIRSDYFPNNRLYKEFQKKYFHQSAPPNGQALIYLMPGFNYGGAEITDYYIVRELSKQGFSIYVFGTDINYDSKIWFDKFKSVAHETIWLPEFIDGYHNQADFISKVIERYQIRFLFNRNSLVGYRMLPILSSKFPKLKLIDLLHTHNYGNDWINYSSSTAHYLHRRFVTSQDLLQYCLRNSKLPAELYKVIYCGTDTDMYLSLSERPVIRSNWLKKNRIPLDARTVTYFGRFAEQKDPLRWVQIAKQISQLDATIYFIMAGDGEMLEKTKQAFEQANLLDKTLFVGRTDCVIPIACATDVLLLSSRFEGLPTVCFEFLMMGVPIISTDVGGTRECISSEELGEVVPIDSTNCLIAERVIAYLPNQNEEQEKLRVTRRKHIVDHFSVHQMGRRYALELAALL